MDDKKLNKDFNSLTKFRLYVFIIIIVLLIILIPSYWTYILVKKKKAKPIISSYQSKNKLPLLTEGNIDYSQASNGFTLSTLGQPCNINADKGAVPNLPSSFKPQPCADGLKCVQGVFEGSICLSDIGYFCDSLNDCVTEADICLNNICSSSNDTINQKCEKESDCQIFIQYNNPTIKPQIYNHICQKEPNKNYGYCKVNLYPYDSGCNSDSECQGESICFNETGRFKIKITVDNSINNFVIDDNINWSDQLNNSVIQLYFSNNNIGLFQIKNYDVIGRSGILIPTSTTPNISLKNGLYDFSLGQSNKGICLLKIPEGGPANLILGGIKIPCDDNTTNIKNYCLKSENPNISETCIRDIVDCPSQKIDVGNNKTYTINPACLYNDASEQIILNNYYYGLSPYSFSIYRIGNCTVETTSKDQLCDNAWNGCKQPYFCIQENNQNNKPVSICTTPFQAQICVNGSCPENYQCLNSDGGPNGEPPICLGKANSNAICFDSSDCIDNQCISNYNVNIFDPKTSKIINSLNTNIPTTVKNEDLHINLGKSKMIDNVLKNKKIIWYSTGLDKTNNTYNYSLQILDENNNIKSVTLKFFLEDQLVKDIIIDENDDILILYSQKNLTTMRKRSFQIASIGANGTLNLAIYNSLISGINVFYYTNNSTKILDPTKIYVLNRISQLYDSSFVLTFNGDPVIFSNSGAIFTNGHFLVTYDNNYLIERNQAVTFNVNSSLVVDLTLDTDGSTVIQQLHSGDEVTYKKISDQELTISSSSVPQPDNINTNRLLFNLIDGDKYYLTAIGSANSGVSGKIGLDLIYLDGVEPQNCIEYVITQGYYHSVGGYPILNNYKVMQQALNTGNNGSYFILNKDHFNYVITSINANVLTDNDIINIGDPQGGEKYIIKGNQATINGLNNSISFTYNGNEDDIKINSKKIDDKSYLIINKGLSYSPEFNNSRYINQIIELEYNISYLENKTNVIPSNNYNYDYLSYIDTNRVLGPKVSIFSFTINKTIAQNQSKGFYYRNIINGENNIDYVNLNNNDSIFYTLINNNPLNNKTENSLAINSKYEKINYIPDTENNPNVSYTDYANFSNLTPLPFSGLVNITKRKNNENYYIESENLIYIYDQTDIDNILNFSSSELVLTKKGNQQSYVNFNFTNNITWCLVNILEYDVTLETEYLIIKIHVPIYYEELKDDILENDKTNWELHVYNYVGLEAYCFNKMPIQDVKSYIYELSDASLLFMGSKGNNYYKDNYDATNNNNKFSFSRTGYNNIMVQTAGKNSDNSTNSIPAPGSVYSIYKITDGAAVLVDNDSSGKCMFAEQDSFLMSNGADFYKSNSNINFITKNVIPSDPNFQYVTNIRPLFIAYNYFNTGGIITLPAKFDGFRDYVFIEDTLDPFDKSLNSNRSLANGRFFPCFVPITNEQFKFIFTADYVIYCSYIPLQDQANSETSAFQFLFQNVGGIDLNAYSQIAITTKNIFKNNNTILRQIFGGSISLPYANYNKNFYVCNDLFSSSLPTGDSFFINSSPITKDFIVSNVAYDKDGNIMIKNLGNIPLYQTHMAHYQTGTNKKANYFNQTNQVAISWPKWIKTRYNKDNQIPNIKKIIINTDDGNNYANTSYYAFIEYNGNTSLIFLDAENTNINLGENQGVPTTKSIFNNNTNINIINNIFATTGFDKFLYTISKKC